MPGDGYLTGIDIEETGDAVLNILNNPDEWFGKWVPFFGEHSKAEEYPKIFESVTGKKAKYTQTQNDLGEDLNQMFAFFAEFGLYDEKLHPLAKKVHHFRSFEQWLKSSGWSG